MNERRTYTARTGSRALLRLARKRREEPWAQVLLYRAVRLPSPYSFPDSKFTSFDIVTSDSTRCASSLTRPSCPSRRLALCRTASPLRTSSRTYTRSHLSDLVSPPFRTTWHSSRETRCPFGRPWSRPVPTLTPVSTRPLTSQKLLRLRSVMVRFFFFHS